MWLVKAQNAVSYRSETFEQLDGEALETRKMPVAMIKKLGL